MERKICTVDDNLSQNGDVTRLNKKERKKKQIAIYIALQLSKTSKLIKIFQ
jgi:hypothetical protein